MKLSYCSDLPVDVTVEATFEEHNITVDNPSTASKEEEKVKPVNSRERKNYLFERFNISGEAPKKLIQLINDYPEWIADGLLKHHAGRYCQQQSKVSQNEECLINIIKGFSIPDGLPWHLINEVYIPINCGDEFHWVLGVVVLKKRRILVYYSMSQRRRSEPSSEISKLAKILPTYLDVSGFLDQKINWKISINVTDDQPVPTDNQSVTTGVHGFCTSLDGMTPLLDFNSSVASAIASSFSKSLSSLSLHTLHLQ
ncbi:hypothetical protein CQW23_23388 [Capsicum baccatum]|uniref:Ubiquitin-like protease family profile domain-containing protein n=1 Tax=Capsicum baccatum TaxID=33114 RepID=A0A2G2VRU6_CAPBA|nr:hypothetical protein CQW23_23388 [Capsicum baccatum]